MRDKVLRVIETYTEGGSLMSALASQNMAHWDFHRFRRNDPELEDKYKDAKRCRAERMVDRAYELVDEPGTDARFTRVKAEILMNQAKALDREAYGDKLDVNVNQQVDINIALSEARSRALPQPPCDLTNAIDAEFSTIPQLSALETTDQRSVEADSDQATARIPDELA